MVVFFTDMFSRCLQAESKTKDRSRIPAHIDTGMFWPPIRIFILCTALPSLAYPLGILHTYGYARCLATASWKYRRELPLYTDNVHFVVYKREYNKERGRIYETMIYDDDQDEMNRAKGVVGNKRSEYVLDPNDRNVSYYLIEQRTLSAKAIFQGENYAWTMIAEFMRFGAAAAMCYVFLPSARRFHADIPLVLRGQLGFTQIRHPVSNFFLSVQDYNKAKLRINAKLPKDARPWNYKL